MRLLAALLTALIIPWAGMAEASADATATIRATAQVASRTSLSVSTETLQFVVTDPDQSAVATVDFMARARTPLGAEIVLTVEAVRAIDGPGGASDVETALTFSGDGEGAIGGALSSQAPVVAGRWSGSGRRSGRLSFALRAGAAGTYTLPVRFVLSAP